MGKERGILHILQFRLPKAIIVFPLVKESIACMMERPSSQRLRRCFSQWVLITRLSFLTKFINTGAERPLTEEDVGACPKSIKTAEQYPRFQRSWTREMRKETSKRSLALALFRSSGPSLWMIAIVLYILGMQVSYITPIVLERYTHDLDADLIGRLGGSMIKWVWFHDVDHQTFWKYCCLLLVLPLITAVLFACSSLEVGVISARIRSQLSSALYRKALYLSASSRKFTSTGQLVNHISSDIPAICRFIRDIPLACSLPFMVSNRM